MNLYQMYSMKPPSKTALADRLTGARSRTTGVAMPVAKSSADKRFFVRNNEVPTSLPNIRTPYPLGAQGGLGGLAGFGSLGDGDVLVGGLNFTHVWSMEDLVGSTQRSANWRTENQKDYGISWTPVPKFTLDSARTAWTTLEQVASTGTKFGLAIQAKLKGWAESMSRAASEVDSTWDGVYAFKSNRSRDTETRRVGALNTIKNALEDIVRTGSTVQEQVAAAKAAEDAALRAAAGGGTTGTPSTPGKPDWVAALQTANAPPSTGKSDQQPKGEPVAVPFYKNPLMLGIAGVLVIGIGIVAMRKKSA